MDNFFGKIFSKKLLLHYNKYINIKYAYYIYHQNKSMKRMEKLNFLAYSQNLEIKNKKEAISLQQRIDKLLN
ncbi:unnamed protein product [Paramecium pentaurelia]|uniref:Uncharacterized protein n=1 Tax=Paramecium pentaurelia TaxID=43138 RepID=A0A8S1ULU4_9CILI|nr:unnamed protein product [Paramecium pentaurelia]